MDFLLPQPSPEGIARTREIGRRKFGRELSDAEAAEILSRVIKYAYYSMQAVLECSNTDSTPENPTTTRS